MKEDVAAASEIGSLTYAGLAACGLIYLAGSVLLPWTSLQNVLDVVDSAPARLDTSTTFKWTARLMICSIFAPPIVGVIVSGKFNLTAGLAASAIVSTLTLASLLFLISARKLSAKRRHAIVKQLRTGESSGVPPFLWSIGLVVPLPILAMLVWNVHNVNHVFLILVGLLACIINWFMGLFVGALANRKLRPQSHI